MDNKFDPIHAVASLSLAMLEIQKDVSQLRRQVDTAIAQLYQIDKGAAAKFKELDGYLDRLHRKVDGKENCDASDS